MPNIKETLEKAGFESIVAEIYLILVNHGELSVPEILAHTDLSRASVYEALPELLAGGYIEYRKEGRNAYYKPLHPSQLASLIEQKKRDVALIEGEMSETIRALVGAYNLASSKPGVQFFEGKEGMLEVLEDSLSSPEVIYTYADIEAIVKYIDAENKTYVRKRDAKRIEKKAIIADSPFARDYLQEYHKKTTAIRFIKEPVTPFGNVMQIYDGKVSYITLSDTGLSGIIISDPAVYRMHKSFFEYMWNSLTEKNEVIPQKPTVKTSSLASEMKQTLDDKGTPD